LTYVAGRRGAALADEPSSECAGYRAFDARLQGFVVAAMLRLMLEAGRPMDACLSKLRASTLTNLVLSFRSCAKFDDAFARRLVTSLPRTIEHVRLELVNSSATSVGGRAILDGLARHPRLSRDRDGWAAISGARPMRRTPHRAPAKQSVHRGHPGGHR